VRAIFILVRKKYRPTKILEGLEQKLGRLEPLSPMASTVTDTDIKHNKSIINTTTNPKTTNAKTLC